MWQKQHSKSSYRDSLVALEADIQHANYLAASLPREYYGDCIQMRLSYGPLAPFFMFFIQWLDYSCTDSILSILGLLHILIYQVYDDGMPTMSSKERKASLREFYAVIYPMLMQLEGLFMEVEEKDKRSLSAEVSSRKRVDEKRRIYDNDFEKDDECGICMENSVKMVLPSCGHAMCIGCFHDWSVRSKSCPFCRSSLKRVKSKDLWVLTSSNDVVDSITLARENLRNFYLYIENLPKISPEPQVLLFDYMI